MGQLKSTTLLELSVGAWVPESYLQQMIFKLRLILKLID